MYQDKLLRYAIPAQKKFAKIYNTFTDGLVSISDSYVLVTEEKFKSIVDQFSGELEYTSRKIGAQFELTITIDGVPFITVGSRDEFEKVGLQATVK